MAESAPATAATSTTAIRYMEQRSKELRTDYNLCLAFVIAWVSSSVGLASPVTYNPEARMGLQPIDYWNAVVQIAKQKTPINQYVLHCLQRAIDKRKKWARIKAEWEGQDPAKTLNTCIATKILEDSLRVFATLPRHGKLCFACPAATSSGAMNSNESRGATTTDFHHSTAMSPRPSIRGIYDTLPVMQFTPEDVEAASILQGMRNGL